MTLNLRQKLLEAVKSFPGSARELKRKDSLSSPRYFTRRVSSISEDETGNVWDALLCFPLGLCVGVLDVLASKSSLFSNVLEFVAALCVSFLAKLFVVYLVNMKLCFSSMAVSSLVQLLPGRTNFSDHAMLPKGQWPKWCIDCKGSGFSYCTRCLGTGERRGLIGFHVLEEDKTIQRKNGSCQ